jgi:hypothetical protein
VRDVDKLNLVPVLDLAEQPILLLLKVCELLASPQTLHLSSFTTNKISETVRSHSDSLASN